MTRPGIKRTFAICILWLSCGCEVNTVTEDPEGSKVFKLPVDIVSVSELTTLVGDRVFYGRITPGQQSILRFQVPGTVQTVNGTEGQQVKAGDELASLNPTELATERDRLVQRVNDLETQTRSAPPTQRPELRSRIAEFRKQEQELVGQMEKGVIRASFDGIVQKINVTKGDPVSPAVSAIVLVEDQQPIVSGQLNKTLQSELDPDQPIWVEIGGKSFECDISARQEPEVNSLEEPLDITLTFVDPLPRKYWLFDDIIETRIRVKGQSEGFQLPASALQKSEGSGWHVLVAETTTSRTRLSSRTVNVLDYTASTVLVSGNLKPGEQVVVNGNHRVVPGQEVVIADAAEPNAKSDGLVQ